MLTARLDTVSAWSKKALLLLKCHEKLLISSNLITLAIGQNLLKRLMPVKKIACT